jgi:hypothetical protein
METMSYSFALTQKVNFYVSLTFILMFSLFLTTTVVSAINRDSPYLDMSAPIELR